MRNGPFWFLFVLSAGCEPCLDYIPTCLPPAMDEEVDTPEQAPTHPPERGFFFWELEKDELPANVGLVGLRATCVNAEGDGVPGTPPAFFGEEVTPPVDQLELDVELDPRFQWCYIRLLINEAELAPDGSPPPGTLSYNFDNGHIAEATLVDDPADPFYRSWVVEIPPN